MKNNGDYVFFPLYYENPLTLLKRNTKLAFPRGITMEPARVPYDSVLNSVQLKIKPNLAFRGLSGSKYRISPCPVAQSDCTMVSLDYAFRTVLALEPRQFINPLEGRKISLWGTEDSEAAFINLHPRHQSKTPSPEIIVPCGEPDWYEDKWRKGALLSGEGVLPRCCEC